MIKRGRGLCATVYTTGIGKAMNPGASFVQVREDGSVVLQTGAADVGQGSNTVLAQICAEELGVRLEDISVIHSDTWATPYDMGSVASRITHVCGNATIRAAQEVKKNILEFSAKELGLPASELEIRDRKIFWSKDPAKSLDFAAQVNKMFWVDKQLLIGKGWFAPYNTGLDPETGAGTPWSTFEYSATVADVEVDDETGVVRVLKIYQATEIGKAINPALVQGQLEGGVVMGVGFGLLENMHPYYPNVKEGVTPEFNPAFFPESFDDYFIPSIMDIPEIEFSILEKADAYGPYGAKGVGEFTMNSIAPAILNAIYDAVGVRVKDLPASPEKVLKAIKEKGAAPA